MVLYLFLCGTAFKNKGVQPLLDAVCDYLPSPIDIGALKVLMQKIKKKNYNKKPR